MLEICFTATIQILKNQNFLWIQLLELLITVVKLNARSIYNSTLQYY